MKVGITTFITDESIGPLELARAVEERGFHSLGVAEHSHIPVDLRSRRPGATAEDDKLPREYYRTFDPFVSLSAMATITSRLLLQTAIALIVQRDPLHFAKIAASVDHLSQGRLRLGIGSGWNTAEMANHGTDPSKRTACMREKTLAVKGLWTQTEAEFHGNFVDFGRVYQWPKPFQQPHPPFLVGGMGPTVLDRVVEFGDGWIPSYVGIDKLGPRVEELRALGVDLGREFPVIVSAVPANSSAIDKVIALEADEMTIKLPTLSRDAAFVALDGIVAAAEKSGVLL